MTLKRCNSIGNAGLDVTRDSDGRTVASHLTAYLKTLFPSSPDYPYRSILQKIALLNLCSVFVLTIGFRPAACSAQNNNKGGGVLYNNSALLRASRSPKSNPFGQPALSGSIAGIVEDQLRFDTVDDMVLMKEKQNVYASQYRSYVYARMFDSTGNEDDLDDLDLQKSIAQRVAVYQTAISLSDFLMHSPLAAAYRSLTEQFVAFQEYITMRVGRKQDGSIGFAGKEGERSKILELKVSASATRGIEPRLRLIDDFMLRYDTIAGGPVLEYNITF